MSCMLLVPYGKEDTEVCVSDIVSSYMGVTDHLNLVLLIDIFCSFHVSACTHICAPVLSCDFIYFVVLDLTC